MLLLGFFFFKQKTAYDMRISDWSSDVCSADLAQRRFVRDVTRGEEQRPILAVQVGKLMFEVDVVMRVAADVARAARTRADVVQRLFHRLDDLGMLTHREIVVRAPDGDRKSTRLNSSH